MSRFFKSRSAQHVVSTSIVDEEEVSKIPPCPPGPKQVASSSLPKTKSYLSGSPLNPPMDCSSPWISSDTSLDYIDYFFSKSSFKDKLVGPTDKVYSQDDKFIDYVSKYCSLLRNFASDLDKLKERYEKPTSKNSSEFQVCKTYAAFSEMIKTQSTTFISHADDLSMVCFGPELKKNLHNQRSELSKLNEDVDKAERSLQDSINVVKSKRRSCNSHLQDAEKVEEKRPDNIVEKLVKHENNRKMARKKLDDSNAEYHASIGESNKMRLRYEITMREAIQRFQQVAEERVTTIQNSFNSFIDCYEKFSTGFSDSIKPFQSCCQQIELMYDVNKFVEYSTKLQKQELEPELVIFDLPSIRNETKKDDSNRLYSIKILKKEICCDKILDLKKYESQLFKNVNLAITLMSKSVDNSHGMQDKFQDEKKSKEEYMGLLNELDVVHVSIQNIIDDWHAINRSSPDKIQSHRSHHLSQYLQPVYEGRPIQYMVVKLPLAYYLDENRKIGEFEIPEIIKSNMKKITDSTSETLTKENVKVIVETISDQEDVEDDYACQGEFAEDGKEEEPTRTYPAVVKFDFDPEAQFGGKDDVNLMVKLRVGERIIVSEYESDMDSEWCLVENSLGQSGHAPRNWFEEVI